tara:strand:- start:3919 stop:4803 length:885 start_codon:yes stop_codon:yes gene_type:complete
VSLHSAKGKKKIGTWSKLVALCTKSMGGYYRSNGTVVRNIAAGKISDDEDAIFVETNVEFANITERTHARIRHQETQRQENIETILSIVSSLIGEKAPIQSVDPDWTNIFFHYAQNVSNKNMQSLWARAMVCELKRPSSISKRSLNFLYHCDIWEITAFKKVANYAFIGGNGHPFIFRTKKDLLNKDDIFTETRLLSHCINAGMITSEPKDLVVGFHFSYNKKKHFIDHESSSFGQSVGFYQQSFTKTGSDIMKLLGGLEAIPSSNMHRKLVWEYLSDFVEIETEHETDEVMAG